MWVPGGPSNGHVGPIDTSNTLVYFVALREVDRFIMYVVPHPEEINLNIYKSQCTRLLWTDNVKRLMIDLWIVT